VAAAPSKLPIKLDGVRLSAIHPLAEATDDANLETLDAVLQIGG
jgi:hypothetical protein